MKYLILTALIMFSGCDSSIKQCVNKGYRGIVIDTLSVNPSLYCSNGLLSPDGNSFITNDGDRLISAGSVSRIYLPITKDLK